MDLFFSISFWESVKYPFIFLFKKDALCDRQAVKWFLHYPWWSRASYTSESQYWILTMSPVSCGEGNTVQLGVLIAGL